MVLFYETLGRKIMLCDAEVGVITHLIQGDTIVLFFKCFVLCFSVIISGCYPFTDRDPFLIEACPHVYFAGNQERYESRVVKGSKSD